MGKKRRNNKYAAPAVPDDRLLQLEAALDAKEEPSITEAEFAGLVARFAQAEAVEKLVSLTFWGKTKAMKKAVNQALFKLKQRGLHVPEIKKRPEPVIVAAPAPTAEDLTFMMSAPHGNAARIFFFPFVSGRSLLFIQAEMIEPIGLKRLRGTPTSRSSYRLLLKQVTAMEARPGEPPPFVPVDKAFVDRKLWELGCLVRAGRTGSDVDHETSGMLKFPSEAPPHPAQDLDLDDVEALSIAELDERKFAVAPIMHETLFDRLEDKLAEIESGVLVLTDAQKAEQAADIEEKLVGEWVQAWGPQNAAEVLLDTALYNFNAGEPRIAKTFLEVVEDADESLRTAHIVRFLTAVIRQLRLGSVLQHIDDDVEDERSEGGIILP